MLLYSWLEWMSALASGENRLDLTLESRNLHLAKPQGEQQQKIYTDVCGLVGRADKFQQCNLICITNSVSSTNCKGTETYRCLWELRWCRGLCSRCWSGIGVTVQLLCYRKKGFPHIPLAHPPTPSQSGLHPFSEAADKTAHTCTRTNTHFPVGHFLKAETAKQITACVQDMLNKCVKFIVYSLPFVQKFTSKKYSEIPLNRNKYIVSLLSKCFSVHIPNLVMYFHNEISASAFWS